MRWRDAQSSFVDRLFQSDLDVPAGIGTTGDFPAKKRFNVYRNNVMASLSDALVSNYPVVNTLVGDEFFREMARVFIVSHPPGTPVLLEYGREFASFIETFAPARTLPYLADVARLEWAWIVAYHAADSDPIAIGALQAIAADQLEEVRLDFHPSFHLIRSGWPAASIWHAHQFDDDPAVRMQDIAPERENAIVVRPRSSVDVRRIKAGSAEFVACLRRGGTLAQAAEPLADGSSDDMGAMLHLLFDSGSIVGVSHP
ncbi:MAG: HvfC/BufC N-terminal domain-containing protein [Hyphomicrobiaceae bacterium]